MVWGCISWNGTGRLHLIEGHRDAAQYCHILDSSFISSLKDQNCNPRKVIFQQDNNPKHTLKMATQWFLDHKIRVLPWLPSSPDQSIIEHVWDALDRQLHACTLRPHNVHELWEVLKEEWEKLELWYIRKLYNSIPAHILALTLVGGLYTHY